MARQTIKLHRQEREIQQPQRRKSIRISRAQEPVHRYAFNEASSIQRPVREAPNGNGLQNPTSAKAKQSVSAAGVFKKKPKVDPRDKKHYRRREIREPTPEPNLLDRLRDGIEITRHALNTNAKANFDGTYAAFSERLTVSRHADGSFVRELTEAAATLSAPLVNEKIETTISKDSKRKVEIVQIGKRVATFKKFVEKEGAKLKEAWKHWEELQNEYIELGIEVFGPEVFGEDAAGLEIRQKGYKREMELLDLEHNARVEELDEEIEDVGPTMLQKMKVSEKELDVAAKKEQARLLQALIQD
ncbi:hypothetical protein N431DRAFT_170937 [Stipitochalara longipes BDJ]|nr:hypothetical protein N431DRAFT_170937 [Stipitochalara longipes BDJ]